jgi:predicted metal-dependent hydrolase
MVMAHKHLDVTVCGEKAALKLVKDRRAKCMRLSINDRTREFRLTLPRWVSEKQGMAFVSERRPLMEKWWQALPMQQPLAQGSDIMWRGETVTLQHDAQAARGVRLHEGAIYVGGPMDLLPTRLLRWMKSEAKTDLTVRTQTIAQHHGLKLTHVGVRDMQSRWGSCTSSGRISLCWRLIMAPDDVRHYVAAHELAHLAYMNHSPAFWREVERLGGDLNCRTWFKHHGAALMRFGQI